MGRIITNLEQALADLELLESDHDVIGELLRGSALDLDEAADAWQRSDETVRKECEKAAAKKRWIGFKFKGRWIIGEKRLLNWIEQVDGLPARLAAESRLRKRAMQKAHRNQARCSPLQE
ncbi:hypothetical protein XH93_11380 [Bradyrhizobium sp. CCBAU 51753]|nr:hypothetical protein XH93_11380 [Bradyrhizobium sp. CCBAU 51753]